MSDITSSENYSVIYSPEAMNDIREIYIYIACTLQVPDIAEKQVNRIRKKVRSLDFMPLRYSIVDWEPWKSMKMRKFSIDNFVVYYTTDEKNYIVTISRIFYGGRNIENIMKES